jgi:hypothetical protein
MKDSVPTGEYEDFATGFVVSDTTVWCVRSVLPSRRVAPSWFPKTPTARSGASPAPRARRTSAPPPWRPAIPPPRGVYGERASSAAGRGRGGCAQGQHLAERKSFDQHLLEKLRPDRRGDAVHSAAQGRMTWAEAGEQRASRWRCHSSLSIASSALPQRRGRTSARRAG